MQEVIKHTKENFPTAKIIDVKANCIVAQYYTADGKYNICMVSDERGRGVNVRVPATGKWRYHSFFETKYDKDALILQRYPPQ